jgi:hypothetical protein
MWGGRDYMYKDGFALLPQKWAGQRGLNDLSRTKLSWFGCTPAPYRSPVSKLDWWHTGKLRKRDNLLTGEGGGRAWSQIIRPERRQGSTRVSRHAFLAWRISWQMVAYIYYCIIQQLETQAVCSWTAPVWATGTVQKRQAVRPSHLPGHSPPASQAGRRVGPAL